MRREGRPLHRSAPAWTDTFGDIAAKVGADLGLVPDTEQQWLLDAIYAETAPGVPAAPEVCVVGPRQNLKSATLEVAALTDLYVIGVPLAVWTAHEFKTARKSFEDMRRRILQHPDYAARTDFRDSHGEEAIFLDSGERLEFHARSGGSGRGFTCSRLTLDEAMYLQPGDLGALAPTMFTIEDAQVRYGSSAGKLKSGALRDLRRRGRGGKDPVLAYVEYGAERKPCAQEMCPHVVDTPGCALDDRDLWWQANCALWAGRATLKAVERQRRMLPPAEFAREFLSWWDDPPEGSSILDLNHWHTLGDAASKLLDPVTLSVEIPLDRARAYIGSAGPSSVTGRAQVEIAKVGAGTDWVVPWLERNPAPVVIDTGNEAASLIPALERVGIRVHKVNGAERAQACGSFYDAVKQSAISHLDDPDVTAALSAAVWKESEGARSFSRRRSSGDISALYAVVLALHGHHGNATGPSAYEDHDLVVI